MTYLLYLSGWVVAGVFLAELTSTRRENRRLQQGLDFSEKRYSALKEEVLEAWADGRLRPTPKDREP